jgi:hypothetical protein
MNEYNWDDDGSYDEEDPTDNFGAMPAGKYKVFISDIEEKHFNAKNGGGEYLAMSATLTVANDKFKGRKLWTTFHIGHPTNDDFRKKEVKRFSQMQRAAIGRKATGKSELIDKFLMSSVTKKFSSYKNEDENEVTTFYRLDDTHEVSGSYDDETSPF